MDTNWAEMILMAMAVGQALLCASILMMRPSPGAVYGSLAVFLLANAVMDFGALISICNPDLAATAELLSIPALLLLAPTFWLYVTRLTAETPPRFRGRDWLHLAPAITSLAIVAGFFALSGAARATLLLNLSGPEPASGAVAPGMAVQVLLVASLAAVLTWMLQSVVYVTLSLLALRRYRQRLKEVFASTEHVELTWLICLALLVGGYWFWIVASIASEILFGYSLISDFAGSLLALALVWTVGLWGLRQKPGFAQISEANSGMSPDEPETGTSPASEQNRYGNSGLTEELAKRIAERIERAMREDHLYRSPNLSLHDLGKQVAASPNHVSQTLNASLGERFFEYVNRWRVLDAIERMRTSEESIQDVAINVGFNSRSAFYKAFKRETGNTPSEFRKAGQKQSASVKA